MDSSSMAMQAVMYTPIEQLPDDELDPLERDKRDEVREQMWFRKAAKAVVILPALGTMGVNAYAAVSSGGLFTIIAAAVTILVGSKVVLSEATSGDMNTVKGVLNALREKLQQMEAEYESKRHLIDDLTAQAFCGEMVKERLENLTGGQDVNLKRVTRLMKEQREIHRQKRLYLRMGVEAELVRLVMNCDSDENGTLDQKERKKLVCCIKHLPNVQIDEPRLLELLQRQRDVMKILTMIKNLQRHGTLSAEQPIVIDLESEKLQKVIEEKAELRESATRLRKSMAQMAATGYKKKKKKKPKTEEASRTPQRARSQSPVRRPRIEEEENGYNTKQRKSKRRSSLPAALRPQLARSEETSKLNIKKKRGRRIKKLLYGKK